MKLTSISGCKAGGARRGATAWFPRAAGAERASDWISATGNSSDCRTRKRTSSCWGAASRPTGWLLSPAASPACWACRSSRRATRVGGGRPAVASTHSPATGTGPLSRAAITGVPGRGNRVAGRFRRKGAEGDGPSAAPAAWQAEMRVKFMGLTGPAGVLPRHYSQLILNRRRQGAARRFPRRLQSPLDLAVLSRWEEVSRGMKVEKVVMRGCRTGKYRLVQPASLQLVGSARPGARPRMAITTTYFVYYSVVFSGGTGQSALLARDSALSKNRRSSSRRLLRPVAAASCPDEQTRRKRPAAARSQHYRGRSTGPRRRPGSRCVGPAERVSRPG